MSDPTAELLAKIKTVLEADGGVATAFAPTTPRAYDIPPTNRREPYLVLGEGDVQIQAAECIDGAETDFTVHVWSLTSPPGKAKAMAIGAAVQAALTAIDTLPSHRVLGAWLERASYLTDPGDGQTAHGVIVVRFSTEPL